MNDLEKSVDRLIASYRCVVIEKLVIEVAAVAALSAIDWHYGAGMCAFLFCVNLVGGLIVRKKTGP